MSVILLRVRELKEGISLFVFSLAESVFSKTWIKRWFLCLLCIFVCLFHYSTWLKCHSKKKSSHLYLQWTHWMFFQHICVVIKYASSWGWDKARSRIPGTWKGRWVGTLFKEQKDVALSRWANLGKNVFNWNNDLTIITEIRLLGVNSVQGVANGVRTLLCGQGAEHSSLCPPECHMLGLKGSQLEQGRWSETVARPLQFKKLEGKSNLN